VLEDISDRAMVCITVRNMPAQVELSNSGNFPQKRDVYVMANQNPGQGGQQLRIRQLAARSFDRNGMMVGWELVDGRKLEGAIERLFADPKAAYLHVHYAAPGCYAARIDRA
jgi:hypothetical protein